MRRHAGGFGKAGRIRRRGQVVGRQPGLDDARLERRPVSSGAKESANPMSIASPGPSLSPVAPIQEPRPGKRPFARARMKLPPTSGASPIAHSGMAMRELSPTIRCEPWHPRPTPPPIV
jgi:hypothetical protein